MLEDVLKFKLPPEYPIDKSHLGTLFALDKTKDGKFYLEEVIDFAAIYGEKQANNPGAVDFMVCCIGKVKLALHLACGVGKIEGVPGLLYDSDVEPSVTPPRRSVVCKLVC